MKQGAKMDYHRIQDEALNAFHIKTLQVHQVRDSYFTLLNLDMGGRLVRNNFNLKLDDQYCEGHLIGAYLATGNQHVDNHTTIDHAKPNCESNEIYKGILGGKSRGVFNGKIFVRQDAQKTNAYQNNKAMLLSDDAVINTKPQLEIFADDVKCSHGATVGQLDEEALFYLRSRGVPEKDAIAMLQYAFVAEALDYVTIEEIREELDEILLAHFHKL
jgi:Fe-S cluster assembly protein SufD